METFVRLFNVSDADKPPEQAEPQALTGPGARTRRQSRTLGACAASDDSTGDAEVAQPGLLETVAEAAECGEAEEAEERKALDAHRAVGIVGGSFGGRGDGGDDDEGGEDEGSDEDGEEVSAGAGGELIGLADFEAIFQRYQMPIINFVYRLVGNREQAYDLAQDVFVKAYKALAGGTKIHAGALSSWLYRIAANTATDALRRKRLIAWLPLSLFNEDRGVGVGGGGGGDAGGSGAEDSFPGAASLYDGGSYNGGRFEQRVADREIVNKVLSQLPEKYAVCLLLYEHEGFSCNEIADILKVSPSAVKMRLMRARERFIALYQQEVDGS